MDIHSLNAKKNCYASSIVYGRVPTKGLNHLGTCALQYPVIATLYSHCCIIMSLHYRPIDPNFDGAILNNMPLSEFHTILLI